MKRQLALATLLVDDYDRAIAWFTGALGFGLTHALEEARTTQSFPSAFGQVWQLKGWITFSLVMLVGLLIMVGMVFVEQSQRRIPVQYAKRMVGRRMYGGTSTYIPIKVNQAGVIPVIFASSILAMPQLIAGFGSPTSKWVQWILTNLQQTSPIYLTAYGVLILFFAFFFFFDFF